MAKKAYVGVSNVARKVKKIYIGVNDVARKVKRGYIGVNGVARLFFVKDFRLVYHQDYLSAGIYSTLTSAFNGKYGFIGGSDNGSYASSITAFDENLTKSNPTSLSNSPRDSAQIGQYGLFTSQAGTTINYYNRSLTKGSMSVNTGQDECYALYNDDYAVLFPKQTGVISSSYTSSNMYYLINSSLTAYSGSITTTNNINHGGSACTTTNGEYALICGGQYSYGNTFAYSTDFEAVDTSGTLTIMAPLSSGNMGAIGVRAGDYALRAGGYEGANVDVGQESLNVYAYDQSLTLTNATQLTLESNSYIWSQKSSAPVGEYGVISVAGYASGSFTQKYDAYNSSLTKQTFDAPNKIRFAGVSVGDAAAFARQDTEAWDAFILE